MLYCRPLSLSLVAKRSPPVLSLLISEGRECPVSVQMEFVDRGIKYPLRHVAKNNNRLSLCLKELDLAPNMIDDINEERYVMSGRIRVLTRSVLQLSGQYSCKLTTGNMISHERLRHGTAPRLTAEGDLPNAERHSR
ncbi:hypothetical protein J6590_025381 [Homalodisca vitripennis]|nr:hypothetical protein J6590_025381 [Homalodisca vitripennis]